MKVKTGFFLGVVWIASALADCNLHQFRWGCNLPVSDSVHNDKVYTVYCRNLPVYVNRESYFQVVRYQHANVNMDLIVDHEFIAGPCIPGSQARMTEDDFLWTTPNGAQGYLYK